MVLNALSEVLLLIGLVLLIAWLVTRFFPPKGINALYGYRTPRSMKDKASWDHAQKLSTRYMLNLTLVFLILGIVFLFVDVSSWSAYLIMAIILTVLIGGFGILIFKVEKSLRQHFPREGNDQRSGE